MDHLNEHEITTPSGSKWTSRGILNILKNPAYRGKAVWGDFEIDVPSLISVRQYNKAQQLREQKRTTRKQIPGVIKLGYRILFNFEG